MASSRAASCTMTTGTSAGTPPSGQAGTTNLPGDPATSDRGAGHTPGEVASVPVGRRTLHAPLPPTHWRSSFPVGPLCCSGHPLLGALWWVAAASAAATCSCRHHERSRSCRRLNAAPVTRFDISHVDRLGSSLQVNSCAQFNT